MVKPQAEPMPIILAGIARPRALWATAAAALAMLIAGGPAQAGSQQAPATQSEAVFVVTAFHDALHRGDTDAAARLLDDKAVIYEAGHAELSKAEYSAHHLPADSAFAAHTHETVLRRSADGTQDIAWVATQGRTTGQYKKQDVDQFTTETMVLHHIAGAWKIIHIHWSSHAAPTGQ